MGGLRVPRWLGWTSAALTFAFWCLGVAVPLAALGARISGGLDAIWDPDVRGVAWVTARQAFFSMLFSGLIGLPLGLLAARSSRRLARWIDALLLLPQGVPTVVAATAWIGWLGRSGVLARLDLAYRLEAVILAHVFFNAPWVALLVAQARRQVPRAPVEVAATLGAGAWPRFRWTVWPSLRGALGAALAQVFAVCSMSFALVLLLGGGPPVETLETAMYSRLRGGALDLSAAAACGAWELVLTLVPWLLALGLAGRSRSPAPRSPASEGSRLAGVAALLGAAIFFVPYLWVWVGGVAPWFGPEFWVEALPALSLSLRIAVGASVGSVLAAILAILGLASLAGPRPGGARWLLSALLALPSGLSVLVLGLGAWIAYGRWIDPFEGSLAAIVGLQIVVFFPSVFRLLWPVAQGSQLRALEAAWSLGASPLQAFRWVEWPRWRAPFFSAFALAGGLALGEVAAVSLFYSDRLVPLPLVVSRWMAQYRFENARAASALLLTGATALMIGVSLLGKTRKIAKGGNHAAGV